MRVLGLDTRGWNLAAGGVVTAVAAGCGPAVVLSDTEGIQDPTEGVDDGGGAGNGGGDVGGDGIDDGVDDALDTGVLDFPPSPACVVDEDCSGGLVCVDGLCVRDEYCYDYYGECCDDECCDYGYGGCYYDCYSDTDCREGELCGNYGYGTCEALPLVPECDDGAAPQLLTLPISAPGAGAIISLAFVDADGTGGEDLVVSRVDGANVVRAGMPSIALPLPPLSELDAVASGDLNGDGLLDLVGSITPLGLGVMLADGVGGFSLDEETIVAAGSMTAVVVLDFDGDGALDVAIAGPSRADLLLGDGAGSFSDVQQLWPFGVRSLIATEIGDSALPDLVLSTNNGARVYFGEPSGMPSGLPLWDSAGYPAALTLAADVASNGEDAIVSFTPVGGWIWARVNYQRSSWEGAMLQGVADYGASGDLLADGGDDFVLVGGQTLTYVRGVAPLGLGCVQTFELNAAYDAIAVGDHDGDGRAEIALSLNAALTVLGSL